MQGPFKGDRTARAADALAEGVQTACSKYALEREKTTQRRLKRELDEQKTLDLAARPGAVDALQGAGRQRRSRATDRLLAATVAGNTLSNITQRQNQLDQFIGEDQSLLAAGALRRADADHHPRQGEQGHGRRQQRARSASRSCSERSIGIALALLSYVVMPARRRET